MPEELMRAVGGAADEAAVARGSPLYVRQQFRLAHAQSLPAVARRRPQKAAACVKQPRAGASTVRSAYRAVD
jgi:hypothetical protein